jgi:hypothetical protein
LFDSGKAVIKGRFVDSISSSGLDNVRGAPLSYSVTDSAILARERRMIEAYQDFFAQCRSWFW